MPMMFSVQEFCRAHRISRGTFYKLLSAGRGPTAIKDRLAHADHQRGCRRMAPTHGARGRDRSPGGGVMSERRFTFLTAKEAARPAVRARGRLADSRSRARAKQGACGVLRRPLAISRPAISGYQAIELAQGKPGCRTEALAPLALLCSFSVRFLPVLSRFSTRRSPKTEGCRCAI